MSCIIFGATNLSQEEVKGKRIIEIGSYNVNGSLRPIIESWGPAEYLGVDIERGPGVDIICNAEELFRIFDKNSFDILISTELLEHVRNWRKVISNIKNISKPSGTILITTRSEGFPYHGYPYDFWRYNSNDMKVIFSDFIIERIERDNEAPGVFVKVKKPINFTENSLVDYPLLSIITGSRVKDIDDNILNIFLRKHNKTILINYLFKQCNRLIRRLIKS
jgi:SAM-dependent methyltransferase